MFRSVLLGLAILSSLSAIGFGLVTWQLQPAFKDHTITREGVALLSIANFMAWISLIFALLFWAGFLLLQYRTRKQN